MGALEDFDVARAEFARLVALVPIPLLEDPTPCSEWTLRQLLNHVVTGTQWFTTVVLGEPAPDRVADQILSDPSVAFARRADEFRAAMAEPDGSDGGLLLEGIVLRLQADLRWLEACEQSWTVRRGVR